MPLQPETSSDVPKLIHFFDKLHPIAVSAGATHSAALIGTRSSRDAQTLALLRVTALRGCVRGAMQRAARCTYGASTAWPTRSSFRSRSRASRRARSCGASTVQCSRHWLVCIVVETSERAWCTHSNRSIRLQTTRCTRGAPRAALQCWAMATSKTATRRSASITWSVARSAISPLALRIRYAAPVRLRTVGACAFPSLLSLSLTRTWRIRSHSISSRRAFVRLGQRSQWADGKRGHG